MFFSFSLIIAPTLEDFESAIVKYGKLRDEVKDLSQSISFGWVKVDLQPAREALSNEAAHWRFMFLDYLKRFVEGYLDELHEYVGRTTGGLKEPVVEGDYDSLVRSMEHMSSFRKRERDTAKMVCPFLLITLFLFVFVNTFFVLGSFFFGPFLVQFPITVSLFHSLVCFYGNFRVCFSLPLNHNDVRSSSLCDRMYRHCANSELKWKLERLNFLTVRRIFGMVCLSYITRQRSNLLLCKTSKLKLSSKKRMYLPERC